MILENEKFRQPSDSVYAGTLWWVLVMVGVQRAEMILKERINRVQEHKELQG